MGSESEIYAANYIVYAVKGGPYTMSLAASNGDSLILR